MTSRGIEGAYKNPLRETTRIASTQKNHYVVKDPKPKYRLDAIYTYVVAVINF